MKIHLSLNRNLCGPHSISTIIVYLVIQTTSYFMYNLCPNSGNCVSIPFCTFWNTFKHLVFQIYRIVIVLIDCHITVLPITLFGLSGIFIFCIIPCVWEIASATSSSCNIGCPSTTALHGKWFFSKIFSSHLIECRSGIH